MAVTQKIRCRIQEIIPHGDRVYTVALRPERQPPRFRPGQFLHLALDAYDPSSFWPDSRAFSIASAPTNRDVLRITYSVQGQFTARMEADCTEGREVWIKMPYGDFVIDERSDVVLFAGGTGISAFTAFLEGATPDPHRAIALAYGARTARLLIYRDFVESCARRLSSVDVTYFVEHEQEGDTAGAGAEGACVHPGRVSVASMWPKVRRPFETAYYISGPPDMLRAITQDLRGRSVSQEAIHIDAWE